MASNNITGPADGDIGTQPTGPNPSNNNSPPYDTINSNQSSVGPNGTTGGTDNVSQGATGSPTSNANTFSTNQYKPGKRLKNPLGYLASYTYQLSLYMITPDAYDAFNLSGRKNIEIFNDKGEAGAYLIAQSGGINNTDSKRAPGFQFDYNIDNVSFETLTSARADGSNINTTEFKFKITEPYGFSLLTKLRNAVSELNQYSNSKKFNLPSSPDKQFFIFGIRFFGYDQAGNIVTGKEIYDGSQLDPNASGNGSLFQTYFDMVITHLEFKIEGKAVIYDITAMSLGPKEAVSMTKGLLDSNFDITAGTVEEAIQKLFVKLNEQEIQKVTNKLQLFPNKWILEGYTNAKADLFPAALVTKEDIDKIRWPSSGALNTQQVNELTALLKSQPKKTQYKFSFKYGTPIIQAINDIVKQSTFLRDALKTVLTQKLEPTDKGQSSNNPNTNKNIQWFNISTKISNSNYDTSINQWAHDITYILQTYQTPVVESSAANSGMAYYGPHKRYDYWYTGENSEIISYKQEHNTTYMNVFIGDPNTYSTQASATGSGNSTNGPTDVTRKSGQYTNQNRMGELGKSLEAQNNYVTSLYDINAYAETYIGILGDPDFLTHDQATSEDQNIYAPFYGSNGFTINSNGGQVFIEIDFKEPIDYDYQSGLLTINDSILFWKYPNNLRKKIKGVVYELIQVTSTFRNGAFKQELKTQPKDFGPADDPEQRIDNTATQNSGPAKGDNSSTTTSQGLKPAYDEFINPPDFKNVFSTNKTAQPNSTVNPQTKVQDDDDHNNDYLGFI